MSNGGQIRAYRLDRWRRGQRPFGRQRRLVLKSDLLASNHTSDQVQPGSRLAMGDWRGARQTTGVPFEFSSSGLRRFTRKALETRSAISQWSTAMLSAIHWRRVTLIRNAPLGCAAGTRSDSIVVFSLHSL